MLAWAPGLLAPAGDEDFAEAPMLCHSIRSGPLALGGRLAGWQTGRLASVGMAHGSLVPCWVLQLLQLSQLLPGLAWSRLPGSLRNERPAALDPDRAAGPQLSSFLFRRSSSVSQRETSDSHHDATLAHHHR